MRRPVLHTLAAYVGGVLLGHICGISQSQGLAATFVCFVLYLCMAGWRRGRRIRDLALLAFAVATSCLYYAVRTDPYPVLPYGLLRSDPVVLFGMVTSDAEEGFGTLRFEVQADSIGLGRRMYAAPCRVQVTAPGSGSRPTVGEVYMFEGELHRPSPLRNPGGFDARGHYARSGISYQLKCSEKNGVRQLRGRSVVPSFNWATSSLRRRLMDTFSRSIGGDEAALLSALLLGERSRTRGAISRKFSDAGVIHILAVSGLHVGILWLALLVVLRIVRIPYRSCVLLSSLFLIYYCYLTGLRPPVVRATIMFMSFSLALLLERELDPLNAVSVAALLILIYNPSYIFDAGFQLSFVCTASIIRVFGFVRSSFPRLFSTRSNAFRRWFFSAFFVSLSAQLASMPLVMYHFNRAPLVPLVANLIVIPLAGADICLGMLVGVLGLFKAPLLGLVASANWFSLRLTLFAVDLFSSIPFSSFRTVRPPVLIIGAWYLILFLLPELRSSRKARMVALLVCLGALNGFVWDCALRKPRPRLSATFLDVGQGDSCLLETSSGRRVLIDAGPSLGEYDCGESIVAPFMWQGRRRTIDTVVLTHPHNDHIGGMDFLLDHFKIGEVVDAGTVVRSKRYLGFLKKVKEKGIGYRLVEKGSVMDFEDNRIIVIHPDKETKRIAQFAPDLNANDCSVVLLVVCGELRLLFTGDIHDLTERVLDSVDRVDLLKAPHHGSGIPNEAILDAGLVPSVAVISVGGNNNFGLPSEEAVSRYIRSGTQVRRTDRDGCVFFSTDGRSCELTAMRELQSMTPIRRFTSNYELRITVLLHFS